jgi:hypothetical protein
MKPTRSTVPARTSRQKLPQPPALVSSSLAKIEQAIGGREALVAALAHAPKDFDYVVGLIGDPSRARTPLATLCAIGGVRAGELVEAYKAGEINRAQALALAKVGERLSDVAEDVMRLSIPHEVSCTACRGKGRYTPEPTKKVPHPEEQDCLACDATGILVAEGDVEHKKLALDLGKMLPKGAGMSINMQQNVANFSSSAGGTLEALQSATDAILYGDGVPPPEAVEAEVEEVPAEAQEAEAAVVEGDWREDLA